MSIYAFNVSRRLDAVKDTKTYVKEKLLKNQNGGKLTNN